MEINNYIPIFEKKGLLITSYKHIENDLPVNTKYIIYDKKNE